MIRLDDLLAGTGGTLLGEAVARLFADFSYDSRTLAPGALFVALVTETGDGHDHIPAALHAGAAGLLCERAPAELPPGVACVLVPNTQQALLDYARYILRARHIDVVAVTGSVGKTSTKEAIAAVLGQRLRVFRSPGNYNGRLGLPISLGRLEDDQTVAVLEIASDALGEVGDLAEAARPRVGVVTAVGASHLQVFGTVESTAQEKAALVRALPPGGVAVLNWDDPRVRAMAGETQARVVAWSARAEGDLPPGGDLPAGALRASEVTVTRQGTAVTVEHAGARHRLEIPLIGAQHAGTVLAASAVGLAFGLSWEEISAGLRQVAPLPGRTRLLAGAGGAELLDDSYNASPESLVAALGTLAALEARRRVVVLGDMAELGPLTEEAHGAAARGIAGVADLLVTIGDLAGLAAEAALQGGLAP
ncbi:MAG: UDP-N-acetylmuramoyl-tripeptide--D-alanyl-D-alanine ligase, partial [Chloroflexi bacterium]|nr:UDP-N-acetylmuramoyl-tripeptide--D-alanyl-D-alanine ligase [Chloroflexota bacterium]